MTSFFTYQRPDQKKEQAAPEQEKKTSDFFSYQKPKTSLTEQEVFGKKEEEPKTFTQKVAESMQDIEETEREIERSSARGVSRIGERIIGLPGDAQNFIKNIFGLDADIGIPFPTSSQLQEGSEKLSQGYTKPQTEFEQKTDELIGDIGSMMVGPAGRTRIGTFGRTIGIPVMGNLTKEGLSYAGADEKEQAYGKLGTMVLLDLMSQRFRTGGAKAYAGKLFNEAEDAINFMPQGHTADATGLQTALNDLERTLKRGGTATSKMPAMKKIREVNGKIQGGRIDPREIVEFRKSINEAIDELGGWELQIPKHIKKRAIVRLDKVKKSVIEAGEHYGRTQNAPFLQKWKSANEVSSVYNKSNVISNFIKKHAPHKALSNGTKILLGIGPSALGSFGGVGGVVGGTAFTTGLTGLNESAKILYRVVKSPELRKYYSKTVTAAAKNNASEFISNFELLDKKLADEEKKEQKKIKELTKH